MTREEIKKLLEECNSKELVLELSTGYGKTLGALQYISKYNVNKILIVIPRLVLVNNWIEEISKWGYNNLLDNITFTTYASLHKHKDKEYDCLCFDECQHLSDRCKDILKEMKSEYKVFLSATIKTQLKWWLHTTYKNIKFITVSLKDAIDNEVLPDPKVFLIPLTLNNYSSTEVLVKKNKNTNAKIDCFYKDRWKYIRSYTCHIKCTPYEYHRELCSDIEYWKKQSCFKQVFKNKWLKLCGDRLKWLSNQKIDIVKTILKKLKDYRVLTFCSSIEQTEDLGKYCINSKNKEAMTYLDMFNNRKIKHITACSMLDEGCNLTDCKVGLFAMINSSDMLIKQRNGRILRHKEPVIIIPYYKNTREEELVQKMLENYNRELVTIINNLEDLKL